MASAYPGGLDSLATDKTNSTVTEDDHPDHHNDTADAANKIEAQLGIYNYRALWRSPIVTPNAADIIWSGSTLGSLTQVLITGTQTITEAEGMLGVAFQDQSANDFNCVLKAHTFSIGDTFAFPVRISSWNATPDSYNMAALVFTDGTTSASNCVVTEMAVFGSSPFSFREMRTGTLTAASTSSNAVNYLLQAISQPIWLRLQYSAADTFIGAWGSDGIIFPQVSGNVSKTMTPTHFGVAWSSFGGTNDNDKQVTFGPVHKVA